MPEQLKAVQIPELSYGDDCIRIDWFGEVHTQRDKQERAAFQIEVLVSVCESSREHRIRLDIPQRIILVSVDALPALWTGSLWKNGRRLRRPGYLNTRSATINFAFMEEQWVALEGSKATAGGIDYPIPKNQIPILRNTTGGVATGYWPRIKNSQLLMICWGTEFPNVLVSAIELARFYGCLSLVLARSLFAGGWPKLEYSPHSSNDVVDGRAKIGVDNIRRMDRLSAIAIAIARYKFSATMRRQINRAGQALSYAVRRRDPFRFGFPFDHPGETVKIECDVVDFQKWNMEKSRHEAHYLVTQIRTCFQPLPFEELEVEFKVSADKGPVDNPDSLIPITMGSRLTKPPSGTETPNDAPKTAPSDPTTVSIDPTIPNAIAEITPFVDQQDRFAAFSYSKATFVSKKTEQNFRSVRKIRTSGGVADGVSTNRGKGSMGNKTEAEISTSKAEPIPSEPITLKSFQDTLKALRSNPEFKMYVESIKTQILDTALQLQYGSVTPFRFAS